MVFFSWYELTRLKFIPREFMNVMRVDNLDSPRQKKIKEGETVELTSLFLLLKNCWKTLLQDCSLYSSFFFLFFIPVISCNLGMEVDVQWYIYWQVVTMIFIFIFEFLYDKPFYTAGKNLLPKSCHLQGCAQCLSLRNILKKWTYVQNISLNPPLLLAGWEGVITSKAAASTARGCWICTCAMKPSFCETWLWTHVDKCCKPKASELL